MKATIFYALVILGVPAFVGLLVGTIVVVPLARLFLRWPRVHQTILPYLEVLNVYSGAVAAIFLCRSFGLTPSLMIPIIMAVWIGLYYLTFRLSLRGLFSWLFGIFIGWFSVTQLFSL